MTVFDLGRRGDCPYHPGDMDREEAAGTLELLRKVVSQARDDTAAENWGVIWILNGISNGAGFVATHVLMRSGHLTPWPYVGLWAGIIAFNGVTIRLFRAKTAIRGSFLEKQIWSIWTVFIVGMTLTAIVNYLIGLSTLFMPAVACILAATAFATMGAMMGTWWYLPAAIWGAMALVMALVPELQFALFGGLWAVTQSTGGALLERARRRKLGK
jgi:hypothetical protein